MPSPAAAPSSDLSVEILFYGLAMAAAGLLLNPGGGVPGLVFGALIGAVGMKALFLATRRIQQRWRIGLLAVILLAAVLSFWMMGGHPPGLYR